MLFMFALTFCGCSECLRTCLTSCHRSEGVGTGLCKWMSVSVSVTVTRGWIKQCCGCAVAVLWLCCVLYAAACTMSMSLHYDQMEVRKCLQRWDGGWVANDVLIIYVIVCA